MGSVVPLFGIDLHLFCIVAKVLWFCYCTSKTTNFCTSICQRMLEKAQSAQKMHTNIESTHNRVCCIFIWHLFAFLLYSSKTCMVLLLQVHIVHNACHRHALVPHICRRCSSSGHHRRQETQHSLSVPSSTASLGFK